MCTGGSTFPGEQQERLVVRTTLVDGVEISTYETRSLARPRLVADMYDGFGKIDQHDQLRQGYLEMERTWPTSVWSTRLFTTLLGMCVVDAYRAYSYEFDKEETFTQFVDKLAYELINSTVGAGAKRTRSATPTIDEADDGYVACCVPVHLKYHPDSQEKVEKAKDNVINGQANLRQTCTVCGMRTVNYCRACSVVKGSRIIVCGPVKGLAEECWSKHVIKKK